LVAIFRPDERFAVVCETGFEGNAAAGFFLTVFPAQVVFEKILDAMRAPPIYFL